MAKKLLIVNQSAGYLTIDVANAFAGQYDEVVLLYGQIRVSERKPLGNVRLQKTIPYGRTGMLQRLITGAFFSLHFLFLVLLKYRRYDVVYYTNPPFSYWCTMLLPNRFMVVVFDIFPDALKLLNINTKNPFYKAWARVNKRVFARADKIITLSQGMKLQLSAYVDSDKIQVVPVWAASEAFRPIKKTENPFVKEHGLGEKFIVMYSGNMGAGHNMEAIIEMAVITREHKDVFYLLIGEGHKKEMLVSVKKRDQLENVGFMTWQEAAVLPFSLAAADVAVVTQHAETAQLSVPSKTFNYMAAGAPLLCITNQHSELAALVEQYGNGEAFSGENVQEMADFVLKLKNDPGLRTAISGRSLLAAKDFKYDNAQKYVF